MRISAQRWIKCVPQLKELRIHMCQTSEASKGAREFVMKHYPAIKKDNPQLPILIRECNGVQPKLWARYEMGKETSVSLTNKTGEDVVKAVESFGSRVH